MTLHRQESLFTMSALNGLLAIRRYAIAHPNVLLPEVVTALKHVSADEAYHNYEAAATLHSLVARAERPETDIPLFFREAITTLVREIKPWWVRLSTSGRDRVKAALSINEVQCFDAAGLFAQPPTAEILTWWDALAHGVRANDNAKLLAQGREAERLTMDYETRRLSDLGISNRPQWISFDDNAAGYDVLSYERGPVEPVAKLIEVKSTGRRPREIFLTRNEWETALERFPNYCFHIWTLPEMQLTELTPSDLSRHVPENNGNGVWQVVRITLEDGAHGPIAGSCGEDGD